MTQPETITLAAWDGGHRGRVLHDARSAYVERCWLPLLGPSTLLFLRFCVRALEEDLDGPTLVTEELGRALGLSGRTGDGAPLRRTVQRAVDFHTVRWVDPATLGIRRHLPELSARQLERAPDSVRRAHRTLSATTAVVHPTAAHALRLARALAALGETPDEIERQLRKWHFAPATASLIAERAEALPPPELPHRAPRRPLPRPGSVPIGATMSVPERGAPGSRAISPA